MSHFQHFLCIVRINSKKVHSSYNYINPKIANYFVHGSRFLPNGEGWKVRYSSDTVILFVISLYCFKKEFVYFLFMPYGRDNGNQYNHLTAL